MLSNLVSIFFAVARGDIVNPPLIDQVLSDGLLDTHLELQRGLPAQLLLQLSRVDGNNYRSYYR